MIIDFKIFEVQQRKYEGGNLFSNNHRFPNLPKSCPMIDIDNIGIKDDNIVAIIENKYIFKSSFGNPITDYSWQKSQFLNICDQISIDLIYHETSTNLVKKIISNTDSIDYDLNSFEEIESVDTADRIYVEIRYNKPIAIMYRTLNMRGDAILSDNIFKIALEISKMLNVNLYLVNDLVGKIYIKKYNSKEFFVINNALSSQDWIDTYKELNLL